MKSILSVDFDFFVREDPALALGHSESLLFLDYIWKVRAAKWHAGGKLYREVIPFWLDINDFWRKIVRTFEFSKNTVVVVSESHVRIVNDAKDLLDKKEHCVIYNFDAHDDLGDKSERGLIPRNVDCGNWVCYLSSLGLVDEYYWIAPDFVEKTVNNYNGKFKFFNLRWSDDVVVKDRPIDLLFLCRSGCWVPPWYDDKFVELVMKSISLNPDSLKVYEYIEGEKSVSPMVPRSIDEAEIIKLSKEFSLRVK